MTTKQINTWLDRRGSLILGVLGFVVTAVVAVFAISAYTANSGQDEQLKVQSSKLTRSLCASANTTASAFREPGQGESAAHFVDRLRAQRKTLRYSFGLGCSNIKGFGDLPKKRREALSQIDEILAQLEKESEDRDGDSGISQALRRAAEDGTGPAPQPTPAPEDSGTSDVGSLGTGGGGAPGGGGTGGGGLLPDSPLGPIQLPGVDCHVTVAGIRVCD